MFDLGDMRAFYYTDEQVGIKDGKLKYRFSEDMHALAVFMEKRDS